MEAILSNCYGLKFQNADCSLNNKLIVSYYNFRHILFPIGNTGRQVYWTLQNSFNIDRL